ncbi:putative membrane protein [Elusimicrobium posterum]|uniref:hypothetical protein n=1 Tax=Elusimicrobium posterum TaxID=3116653 RepID=UPI003C7553F6
MIKKIQNIFIVRGRILFLAALLAAFVFSFIHYTEHYGHKHHQDSCVVCAVYFSAASLPVPLIFAAVVFLFLFLISYVSKSKESFTLINALSRAPPAIL